MTAGRRNSRAANGSGPAQAQKGAAQRKTRSPGLLAMSLILVLVLAGATCAIYARQRAGKEATREVDTVKIETSKGPVVLEVYPRLMPVTVKNFEDLAKSGFYNSLVWHRVEDWVIQTGDPTGTGTGGSGKKIKLETNPELKNLRGAVGMARSQDPNSASSQFYVLKTDAPWLDGSYAVFGKVVSGMDAIDQIRAGDKTLKVMVEQGEPAAPRPK